jgi:putrescine transport system substrate-binding protein
VSIKQKSSNQLLKKITLALTTLVVFSLTTTSSVAEEKEKPEEKVLNIYNWSNYIADDTVKNFEKETGIKVRYDVFDTNEILLAKLVAGNTGYDIVVPTDRFAQIEIAGGLFRKLDKSKLPNLKNIDPIVMANLAKVDPGNNYLVDWLWGYVTVGINTKKVKAALGNMPMPNNPMDLLFNPTYAEKLKSCGISFMDSGAEVLPTTLLYMGKNAYSSNPADYKEAGALLKKLRPFIRVFSSSGYINDLTNGDLCAVMGYSGDIFIARQRAIQSKNGNDITALLPTQPAVMFFDTMAIPKDAKHPNNAMIWMNYIMRPEVHASLTNKVYFATPNLASLKFVSKDIVDNKTIFITDEEKKRMVGPEPISSTTRNIVARTFAQFKAGR